MHYFLHNHRTYCITTEPVYCGWLSRSVNTDDMCVAEDGEDAEDAEDGRMEEVLVFMR